MRFSDFINHNIDTILLEWEVFARALPPGKDMDVRQLRDHAREILETIAEDMDLVQSQAERANKSKGEGKLMKLSLGFAKKHAGIRHEEGFDLNQVIAEYRALRASVIHLWTRNMQTADTETLYELTRFNEEIDQALTYSVQEFLAVSERNRRAMVKKLQDSEERYRAIAESLQRADKHKDEFLAVLAHELRNPLSPVQTGIEILRMTEGIPPPALSPLKMMERQMVHLIRLVDDLLDISRINQGKVNLHLRTVDITDVIRKAVEATSVYFSQHGNCQVSVEFSSELLYVKGDSVRLVQILSNLLSNACKHSTENGQVWVSARREGERVQIIVRDNGVGMAPEKINKLFDMFKQLDEKSTSGLGIGLALARKLMDLHGGTIEGRSEGLEQGSEFVLCLPLLQSRPQAVIPENSIETAHLDGRKILVVDDNQDAAESLNMLLQLLGGQLRLAHDGPAALATLEEFCPDLIFLDIGLPGMDGYEVARRIREGPCGKTTKIVALTGLGQDEDRQRSLQAGIDEHLVKPVNLQEIKRVLGV